MKKIMMMTCIVTLAAGANAASFGWTLCDIDGGGHSFMHSPEMDNDRFSEVTLVLMLDTAWEGVKAALHDGTFSGSADGILDIRSFSPPVPAERVHVYDAQQPRHRGWEEL